MAIKTETTVTDDLTGESGADTYVLGYRNADGNAVWIEIDLTEKNAEKHVQKFISLLTEKGRVVAAEDAPQVRNTRKYTRRGGKATNSVKAGDTDKVRAWARENGLEVSERGRISNQLREQYAAAQTGSAA